MSSQYNTYPSIPPPLSQQPNIPLQQTIETIPSNISSSFKRQNNDLVLWFSNPPLNIQPNSNPPVHSMKYLQYKQKQKELLKQEKQVQEEKEEKEEKEVENDQQ